MEFVLSGFIRTFVMPRFTYKRCKSAMALETRENTTTPVIISYVSMMYVVLADFDCVELFLFNSSKCQDQMKQLELFPVSANGLVSVVNNKVVTTSLQVSKVFEKTHHNVLRDIRNLECSSDFQAFNFESSFYLRKLPNNATKKEPMYYLTRDGFTFLAMGFTGKKFEVVNIVLSDFIRMFVTSEPTYDRCKSASTKDNRKHKQFYFDSLHTSLMYVGSDKLESNRAAILFNSSN